jgi:hypothetical protein
VISKLWNACANLKVQVAKATVLSINRDALHYFGVCMKLVLLCCALMWLWMAFGIQVFTLFETHLTSIVRHHNRRLLPISR